MVRTGTLVAIKSHAGAKIRVCGCAREQSYYKFMIKKRKKESQNANTFGKFKMSQINAINTLRFSYESQINADTRVMPLSADDHGPYRRPWEAALWDV